MQLYTSCLGVIYASMFFTWQKTYSLNRFEGLVNDDPDSKGTTSFE